MLFANRVHCKRNHTQVQEFFAPQHVTVGASRNPLRNMVRDALVTSASTRQFESERFENLSGEWRARESYEIVGADEFIETFEIAEPGKDFQIYSQTKLTRTR